MTTYGSGGEWGWSPLTVQERISSVPTIQCERRIKSVSQEALMQVELLCCVTHLKQNKSFIIPVANEIP